ncbi:MAG TPA: SDR family NAD(P)-dependent oxidoreductase [Methylibium sp.]|uniref:SDR family NAD(P)-dependent oxidoreductase n=1 Tax=Methylibium sp. TaxID=2067992 RepID=UPI002DBF1320|nr:SDR family NAD(P)-dependent oxidoreductase [Methylibium sp.]HEU4459394.1 SDR family NAD(P)-dependent oxidoreductase [Methylibium sp.]
MTSKVVVVTGASDGIGAELARQLAARDGAALALVLAARGEDKLAQVGAQCEAHGTPVLVQRCDVAQQADCTGLIAAAVARFGRIDAAARAALQRETPR